jgi:heptosyltransferase-2
VSDTAARAVASAPPAVRARVVAAAMRFVSRQLARRAHLDDVGPRTPLPEVVRHARRVLVVALAEAGDMVLLSPFLTELRRRATTARITLVCLPAVRGLFESSADVDEVMAYDAAAPRVLRPLVLPRRAREFATRRLVDGFDVAIVPRWDSDQHLAAAVAAFSRSRRRVWHSEQSTARKRTLNAGFDALFTDVVTSSGVKHEVERHLDMLRALGATAPPTELRIALTDDDRHRASEALSAVPRDVPLVALGIGAAHPKRRWPVSRFAEVGAALRRERRALLVVVGGPHDVGAQAELLAMLGPDAIGLAGRLTLRESAAAIARCQLFIGCDSAPMHLAAATGVPCVEVSCHPLGADPLHNNAPERFAPWGVPSVVVRPAVATPPCASSCDAAAAHCILSIAPATVVEAAGSLLGRSAAAGVDAVSERR